MNTTIRTLLAFLAGAVLAGASAFLYIRSRAAAAAGSGEEHKDSKSESGAVSRPGNMIQISPEAAALANIVAAPGGATARGPEYAAPGTLEEDPGGSFTVRAPFAGTLRAPADGFVNLTKSVADGAVVATLSLRIAPQDKLDIATKIAAARLDRAALESQLPAARSALERAKLLNADHKNVADRVVEEAGAKLREIEERRAALNLNITILEDWQKQILADPGNMKNPPAGALDIPLICSQGGEVVEILAHPGESVEAGAAILRVQALGRILARVAPRAGDLYDHAFESCRVTIPGDESLEFLGKRLGAAPAPAGSPTPAFWIAIETRGAPLRSGMQITAWLPVGNLRWGVSVPKSAVVRFNGEFFVYLQKGAGLFERRRLTALDVSMAGGPAEAYFTTKDISDKDVIVFEGAQVLLSEELKSLIPAEDAPADAAESAAEHK